MLMVHGKTIGQRRALFDSFSVPPPPGVEGGGGPMKLRDLIAHVVIEEVAGFEKRQRLRWIDRVLTQPQIDQAAARGKISPEGREASIEHRRIDPGAAVPVALEAFTDGLYLVVLDDIEYRDLDDFISINSDSRLTFIRLTFLAGA